MKKLGHLGVFLLCAASAGGCGQERDIGVEQQYISVGGASTQPGTCGVGAAGLSGTVALANGTTAWGSPYNGASDAMLIASSPTTNYGHYTFLKVKGGGDKRHDVLRWDLTGFPSASTTVTRACLELTLTYSSARTFPVFEVLRDWNEATVSWDNAAAGVPWATPGGTGTADLGTTELGVIPAGASVGTFAIELPVALVQKWVTQPSTNHGVMFANDAAKDPLQFSSQQASSVFSRPKLVVAVSP